MAALALVSAPCISRQQPGWALLVLFVWRCAQSGLVACAQMHHRPRKEPCISFKVTHDNVRALRSQDPDSASITDDVAWRDCMFVVHDRRACRNPNRFRNVRANCDAQSAYGNILTLKAQVTREWDRNVTQQVRIEHSDAAMSAIAPGGASKCGTSSTPVHLVQINTR